MSGLRNYIGIFLIFVGLLVLLFLVSSLSGYISDFSNNPIHTYITGYKTLETPLNLGHGEITIPREYLNIVALFFGFMFLKIWLHVGIEIIKAGRQVISSDVKEMKGVLKELLANKE